MSIGGQVFPVEFGFGEEREGSVDVSADKFVGAQDGTVDMALGRKVDYGGGLIAAEQLIDEGAIVDVAMHEFIAGIAGQRRKVRRIARVSEAIEVHNRRGFLLKPLQDEVGSDEPGAAGNDDGVCHKALGCVPQVVLQLGNARGFIGVLLLAADSIRVHHHGRANGSRW